METVEIVIFLTVSLVVGISAIFLLSDFPTDFADSKNEESTFKSITQETVLRESLDAFQRCGNGNIPYEASVFIDGTGDFDKQAFFDDAKDAHLCSTFTSERFGCGTGENVNVNYGKPIHLPRVVKLKCDHVRQEFIILAEDPTGDFICMDGYCNRPHESSDNCPEDCAACKDSDGDGYGTGDDNAECSRPEKDCDDANPLANPGRNEDCSTPFDDNCRDGVNEGCPVCTDSDGDGYGIGSDRSGCPHPELDCDDSKAGIHPGAAEICGNGIDENCNPSDDACGAGCSNRFWFEIESVTRTGDWKIDTAYTGFFGTAYFDWTGGTHYPSPPGHSVLSFPFCVSEDGDYIIETYGRRDKVGECAGAANDLCNDIWTEIKGTWYKKMNGGNWGAWSWNNKYDPPPGSNPVQARFSYTAGNHDIKITGRSHGTKIDVLRITKVGVTPLTGVQQETPTNLPAGSLYQPGDLIALHFDHAPDPDDGLAAPAMRTVLGKHGISPIVVTGTVGKNSDSYHVASEHVMDKVFGSGGYLNAKKRWDQSVATAASRWLDTLNAGGDIWVAEAGQSDFTADVVRRIKDQAPTINTQSKIHVVQHSSWNIEQTTREDRDYVRSNADFIRIEDGNNDNSNADLNQNERATVGFIPLAKGHPVYGEGWTAGFEYYDPLKYAATTDFSDTVELLHILGYPKSQVAGINDFGEVFLK